jgi:hypothetical protein
MSNAEVSDTDDVSHPIPLDPFAFYEGAASRIKGLGGEKFGHDSTYVFHTPYVDVSRGRASFAVQFQGLRARRGTIHLYVNMLAADGKSFARLVTSQRISLNRLMETGGWTSVEFEGYRGMRFAIFGHITDDTDAEAAGLEVSLINPARDADERNGHEEAHTTAYRAKNVRATPFIVDLTQPSFADPVSQTFTAKQTREPTFAAMIAELAAGSSSVVDQWEQAYILQVARRYGLLASDARAIGFGTCEGAIAAAMERRGLQVAVHSADLPNPAQADAVDAPSDAGARDIPADLVNFDMVWSRGILGTFNRYQNALTWIERSLRCVRPGGTVVHVDRILERDRSEGLGTLERFSLVLIARGYEVARLKLSYDIILENDVKIIPFGFIARRAPTPV